MVDENMYLLCTILYRIGYGLVGGNWNEYRKILELSKTEFIMYNKLS